MFSFLRAFSITMESFWCLSFVFFFLKNFLHFAQTYLSHSDISHNFLITLPAKVESGQMPTGYVPVSIAADT